MRAIIIFLVVFSSKISYGQDSSKFKLLTYGLQNILREDANTAIANKWGIEFNAVAGCLVSQALRDSVAKENKIVKGKIAVKYGKDWEEKFESEVDQEYTIRKKISKLINRQAFIKHTKSELEKSGRSLYYKISPTLQGNIYHVIVDSPGKWEGKNEFIIYQVDYKNKIVRIISDKTTKE